MEPEESAKLAALFLLLGLFALLFLSWTFAGLALVALAIVAGLDARRERDDTPPVEGAEPAPGSEARP